jgi:hypothetical protein
MFNIKISQTTKTNVLYLIVFALAVSYIMNKQLTALVSLLFIGGFIYVLTKNKIISLIISIIITNLLLSMNYFPIEGYEDKGDKRDKGDTETTKKTKNKNENQVNNNQSKM